MSIFINFENIFVLILLDILDIEAKENSDIDELENFNTDV